ncbi:monovalent cation:proton antiporter family protein [Sulfuricystis thermophila]|uniref:monovalent cation:proton antiporter family protein n=1 Tax=Sulfuricystis thermophila TaxID=2496847 RepID=UPI0010360E4F|nr:monovalent cation:proton antiporter family protein [Sulfuricystis thermophila]
MTLHLILLLLAAVVLAVVACRSLNLPPILGYLLVGALAGPHALGMLPDTASARRLAEFGVVFLMFTIGLEFSLPRLFAMQRIVFGLGLLQVLATMLAVAAGAMLWGVAWQASLALGGALAMSSTAILSKLLADRRELDAPHGREVIGVLLFQDLAVVPLLVLIPALSQPLDALAGEVAWALAKAALLLALVLFVGQRLMRAWFGLVARRKSGELFMLNVLLVTLGFATLTEVAGLSPALGAFVAGMLISETEYRYQVEEDIKPFRDVLLGLFFVSTGMLLDPVAIWNDAGRLATLLALLLAAKLIVAAGLSRLLGSAPGTALRTGLWLCTAGEFGFVLVVLATDAGLVDAVLIQPVLAAMVLSMIVAPLIVHFSDRLVLRFVASEWLTRSLQLTQIAARTVATEKHAILCGYGKTGQHLARFLETENIGYMALDLDPERVREAAAAGEPVAWGDCTRRENLLAAGITRASVLVVTFADIDTTLRLAERVRELRPDLAIVARAREEEDVEKLYAAGVAEVVPEALESSVMLATHALALTGVPMHRVVRRLRELREQHYALLRGFFHGATDATEGLADAELPRLHAVTLDACAWAVGRRIAELELEKVGAGVTALRRRSQPGVSVGGATVLEANDVVVLRGSAAAVAAGEELLLRGPK